MKKKHQSQPYLVVESRTDYTDFESEITKRIFASKIST